MRFGAIVLLLALAGCHGPQHVGVDVAFDVDGEENATDAKCIASSGGTCQIDIRGKRPLRVALQPGEMRRFIGIGPGVPICVEAEAAQLADCQPITFADGYARIRKGRYNRVGAKPNPSKLREIGAKPG
jgi:hypothetical protein